MARSFRSDHDNINVCRRNDLFEVDVEAVSECKCLACCKVVLDIFLVESCLLLIVYKDHDDVCCLYSVCCEHNCEAVFFCLCCGLGALVKTYYYINTGIS